ncbi:MAG: hypothetical protein C5B59_16590 [Bacteroidetes bacterium]|nr:MAG: hypothetical protein C5B59_16590 [Bacteroidota bacterium]
MKHFISLKIIFLICMGCALTSYANATNLRGKILRQVGNTTQPASNVRVDLMIYNSSTHAWQDVSSAVTGPDGYYYFLNFSPNQLFYISVNGRYYPPQQSPPMIQSINPGSPPYYQDISPILI